MHGEFPRKRHSTRHWLYFQTLCDDMQCENVKQQNMKVLKVLRLPNDVYHNIIGTTQNILFIDCVSEISAALGHRQNYKVTTEKHLSLYCSLWAMCPSHFKVTAIPKVDVLFIVGLNNFLLKQLSRR